MSDDAKGQRMRWEACDTPEPGVRRVLRTQTRDLVRSVRFAARLLKYS